MDLDAKLLSLLAALIVVATLVFAGVVALAVSPSAVERAAIGPMAAHPARDLPSRSRLRSDQKLALRVAASYWKRRRPATSCSPAAIRIRVVASLPEGRWGEAPIGGCLSGPEGGAGSSWIRMTAEPFRYGWLWSCSLIVHEYGHLIGLRHSGDRAAIMFRDLSLNNFVPACLHR